MNRNRKIKIKNKTSKLIAVGLSAALAAAPSLASVPVYAAGSGVSGNQDSGISGAAGSGVSRNQDNGSFSKEDTVYVFADAAGNATDTTVSSHLILGGATGAVKDSSDLSGITNVKGDETFTDQDGTLVWEAAGEDIFYQGTTSKSAPVSVHLSYLLDGKEIFPEDLAGKSGHLTIRVQYENHSDVSVNVGGKTEDIKTPFLMMTGLILPADTFSNITVDNGRIVNSGGTNVVLGYGMPGLKESLKLAELEDSLGADAAGSSGADDTGTSKATPDADENSEDSGSSSKKDGEKEAIEFDTTEIRQKMRDGIEDLNISDTFEVSADVTDFSMGSTYTFAMSDLFENLSTDDFFTIDDINDAMDKIREAGIQLADGSGELYEGAGTLKDGYGELDDGIKTLKDGVGELASGSGTLKSGIRQYIDGVDTLASGVTSYLDGTDQLAKGVQSLSDLQEGISQLKSGINTLAESTGSDSELITGVNSLNSGMQQLEKAANAIDVDKISQLVKAGQGTLDAAGINLSGTIETFDGLESAQKQVDDLISQIDQLSSAIQQLGDAQSETFDQTKAGAKQITDGVSSAVAQSSELKSGLKSAVTPQVSSAVKSQLSSDGLPSFSAPSLSSVSNVENISVDTSGLDEEAKAQVEAAVAAANNQINQANEQINSANGQINSANEQMQQIVGGANQTIQGLAAKMPDLVDQSVSAAVDAAVDASVSKTAETVGSQINSTIDEKIQNSGQEHVQEGVKQLNTNLGALKKKAQAVSKTLGNVIGSSSYQSLKEQLPGLKSTLNDLVSADPVKKLGTLQGSVGQLADGTASLKKAMDKQLVPGIQKLNKGAGTLSEKSDEGITALQDGMTKLTSNNSKLRRGAKQVTAAGSKLFDGADALVNGIEQLRSGSGDLSRGSDSVKDGIDELHDGAGELHDGLAELNEQGIEKIADLVDGDLTDLYDRVKAVSSKDAAYTCFSGAADGMETSVKFVIETEGIGEDD